MLDVFFRFLYPYQAFLMGAAYNIQQTIESAGIGSSHFLIKDGAGHVTNSYWSPAEAMVVPLGALLLYCLLLSLCCCAAGYALARKKGLIIVSLSLCLPGVLSLIGYWPTVNFMPEIYYINNGGALGSPYGIAALATIALLSGWTAVVIATDIFGLQDRFRHLYDHLWYSIAILAGLFFVADAGTSQVTRELHDTTKHMQQARAC